MNWKNESKTTLRKVGIYPILLRVVFNYYVDEKLSYLYLA